MSKLNTSDEARAALAAIIDDGMAVRSHRVSDWPDDEAAAYRIDGWSAGVKRARDLQVSKTVDRVMQWADSHPSSTPSIREDGAIEVGDYPDGKFACDCGRNLRLWWNGGELDEITCECGIEWWGEHAEVILVKRLPRGEGT